MLKSNRACLTPKEMTNYLNGSLTDDERFEIEHHMQDCPLCEAAMEGYATTNSEIPVPNMAELRGKRTSTHNTSNYSTPEKPQAKVIPMKRNLNWLAAASVVGLLIFAGIRFNRAETDLYADFHQTYDKAILATRSNNAIDNPELTQALEAYNSRKFSESIALFEAAKEKDPENSTIALYAGLSALENGDYKKSSLWLSEARINQPSAYGTATWYLAMTYLAAKDYSSCRNMLKQLGASDSPYYEQAQKLLKKLNK